MENVLNKIHNRLSSLTETQIKVRAGLEDYYKVIKNIPSDIGLFDSRPLFVEDKELIKPNLMTECIDICNKQILVRSYSPTWRQKDDLGYYYVVYYNIL